MGAAGTSQYFPSSPLPPSHSAFNGYLAPGSRHGSVYPPKAYGSSEWLLFAMATVARCHKLGWLTAEMFFVGLEGRSPSAGLVSSAVSPP